MKRLSIGVTLQGVYLPSEFVTLAQTVENLGYDSLWMTDSALHSRNPYVHLALAAGATSRISLGTAVTNPRTRHPGILAVNAATLDEVAPGRTILGIGSGDRPLRALGERPARLAEMRAAIGAIRQLLRGEHVTTDGLKDGVVFDDAHLRFAANPEIPIFMSASGPKALELAGEIADGVIFLGGLFPEGIAFGLEHVERGAERAGRDRPHFAVFCYGAIDDEEPNRALEAARTIAAWFPQTAPIYCELAGLDSSIAEAVRQRYAGGEFQEAAEAAEALPDDFVHKVALAGGTDVAREHLSRLTGMGVDSAHVFPLGGELERTIEQFAIAAAEVNS
ncbi:MAG: LLM class flavin-dependent oxidoreductase [Acidimicrobiia bacterium]